MKKNDWRGFIWTTKEPKLAELQKILKKIFNEMWYYYDRYLKQAEDLPYWSTEMDLVGKIVMSAARLGYSAALEFYPEKSGGEGRGDLWLFFPSKKDLIVEAKRDENISIKSELKTISDSASWYLSDADKQLQKYSRKLRSKPSWCASIYFAQIYIAETAIAGNYPEMVQKLLCKCKKIAKNPDNNISFFAHYFLKDKTKFHNKKFKYADSYYPGVAIFGRIRPIPAPSSLQ